MTSSNTLNFISVVIPAYNEERRIGQVVEQTRPFAKEVIVVDDNSRDGTKDQAKQKGARVVTNELEKGYIGAIKTGFRKSRGEILVTMDGDGEHDPKDIPKLTKPIITNQADLVVGKRKKNSPTFGKIHKLVDKN